METFLSHTLLKGFVLRSTSAVVTELTEAYISLPSLFTKHGTAAHPSAVRSSPDSSCLPKIAACSAESENETCSGSQVVNSESVLYIGSHTNDRFTYWLGGTSGGFFVLVVGVREANNFSFGPTIRACGVAFFIRLVFGLALYTILTSGRLIR